MVNWRLKGRIHLQQGREGGREGGRKGGGWGPGDTGPGVIKRQAQQALAPDSCRMEGGQVESRPSPAALARDDGDVLRVVAARRLHRLRGERAGAHDHHALHGVSEVKM